MFAFRVIMEPVFTSMGLQVAVLLLLTILKTGELNFISQECVFKFQMAKANTIFVFKGLFYKTEG